LRQIRGRRPEPRGSRLREDVPTAFERFTVHVMSGGRSSFPITGQRLIEGAVGHADLAKHEFLHQFGKRFGCHVDQQLLHHAVAAT